MQMKLIPADNNEYQKEDRVFVPVKELWEDKIPFKVEKIIVKDNCDSKWSNDPVTNAYVDILTDIDMDEPVKAFTIVNQQALLSGFITINGEGIDPEQVYLIDKVPSKAGNSLYYRLFKVQYVDE